MNFLASNWTHQSTPICDGQKEHRGRYYRARPIPIRVSAANMGNEPEHDNQSTETSKKGAQSRNFHEPIYLKMSSDKAVTGVVPPDTRKREKFLTFSFIVFHRPEPCIQCQGVVFGCEFDTDKRTGPCRHPRHDQRRARKKTKKQHSSQPRMLCLFLS